MTFVVDAAETAVVVAGEVLIIKSDTAALSGEMSDEKVEKMLVLSKGLSSEAGFASWNTAGLIATGDSGVIGLCAQQQQQ